MARARWTAAGAERGLGLAVEVAVQPGQRLHQFLGWLRVIDRLRAVAVLALAVHPPPVHLEFGGLGRAGGLAIGELDQCVEPPHAGPGAGWGRCRDTAPTAGWPAVPARRRAG